MIFDLTEENYVSSTRPNYFETYLKKNSENNNIKFDYKVHNFNNPNLDEKDNYVIEGSYEIEKNIDSKNYSTQNISNQLNNNMSSLIFQKEKTIQVYKYVRISQSNFKFKF